MSTLDADDFSMLMTPGPVQALLVIDNDVLKRLGAVVRHLTVGMIDEAVQMTVLSRSVPSLAGELIGPSRVLTPPKRWLPWAKMLSPEELVDELNGVKPAIVHCLSSDLAHWALPWATAWKSVLVVHLTDLRDLRAFGSLRHYPHIAAIATTKVIEQALIEAYPSMDGKVSTVPLGIPSGDEPACFSHPQRVPTVLVTTPLEHGSGLEIVLKALHAVVETGQELHVFVLSDGSAEASFRRQLDRLRLRSAVTFAGSLHDQEAYRAALDASDLYIVPFAAERFTTDTLTAMAAGLAIIAPAGSIEDYLIDGQTAALFESRSGNLAEKWLGLLQDRERARQLGEGAQEYLRSYHKASFMVCAIAVLYRQAAAQLKGVATE